MPFNLFLTWTFLLLSSAGLAQSNSIQNLDFTDAQALGPGESQALISTLDTNFPDFGDSSLFADMESPGLDDSSLLFDTDGLDLYDSSLLSSILDASCSDDAVQPSKRLKARGASCVNQVSDASDPSTKLTGEAAGAMTAEGYWCYAPGVPFLHNVPVCDQLYPGAGSTPQRDPDYMHWDSPYHSAVYPATLSKCI